MSTGVTIGLGTVVRIGEDDGQGGTTWTQLLGIEDVTFPAAEFDEVKATHMQSTAHEYIPGVLDNGTVTIPLHYVPGSDTDTLLRRVNGTEVQVEFTAANGGDAETFWCVVLKYARTAPVEDKMTAELSLRINGSVV